MNPTIREERLKIGTVHGGQIFLRRIEQDKSHAAVLMLHGLGCSGDVFLNESRGLANYLCEMGFTVYVPDMIGHGQSWPHRSKHMEHSVHDIIATDIPKIVDEVEHQLKGKPLFLVGQGFGSVLLLSAFARSRKMQKLAQGFVHFNARRSTQISGVKHTAFMRFLWHKALPVFAAFRADVPLQWTPHSFEPELLKWYQTSLAWTDGDWIDQHDQFNYGSALRELALPPSLYFASRNHGYHAHISDVREFMRELGTHNGRLLVLAKGDGNVRNYPGLSMLQHDDAWVDHFPVLLDWLNDRIRQLN